MTMALCPYSECSFGTTDQLHKNCASIKLNWAATTEYDCNTVCTKVDERNKGNVDVMDGQRSKEFLVAVWCVYGTVWTVYTYTSITALPSFVRYYNNLHPLPQVLLKRTEIRLRLNMYDIASTRTKYLQYRFEKYVTIFNLINKFSSANFKRKKRF